MPSGLAENGGDKDKGEKEAPSFDAEKPRRTPSEIIGDLEKFKYNFYKEKYINGAENG